MLRFGFKKDLIIIVEVSDLPNLALSLDEIDKKEMIYSATGIGENYYLIDIHLSKKEHAKFINHLDLHGYGLFFIPSSITGNIYELKTKEG